jgi:hypothetical protein
MLEAAQGQQAIPPWRAFDGWGAPLCCYATAQNCIASKVCPMAR